MQLTVTRCIARAYSFTCALLTMDTYCHRVTNSKWFYDNMQWGLHYYFIVQDLMQMTFFYDLTMATNDFEHAMINQECHILLNNTSRKHVGYVFACYFDKFK